MTLGGLALAVGILVDDGTVTIENINYHLEQGKAIEPAILDGAQQIVIPAFVTLLCLCIVFVPMFQLGGVAGYLFRPMAEAVVFALIGSFLLSRTLVPTMANYLMRGHAWRDAAMRRARCASPAPRRRRNPLQALSAGASSDRFARVRERYRRLLSLALGRPKTFIAGFLACVLAVVRPWPFLGQNFFPGGRFRADPDARARPARHPHRGDGAAVRPRRADRAADDPAQSARQHRRQYRPAVQRHQHGLPEHRHDRPGGWRRADLAQGGSRARPRLTSSSCAPCCRSNFPGTTFSFLPADIVSQILNFGLPAPIDVQVIGNNQQANYAYATDLLKRIRTVPGIADAAHPAGVQLSADQRRRRPHAGRRGRAHAARRRQQPVGHAVGQRPGEAEFLAQPENGVSYPIVAQMPQYRIDTMSDLVNVPVTSADTQGAAISRRPRDASRRGRARASSRITTSSR